MENIFQEFGFKCDRKTYPAHSHTGYQIIYLKKGRLSLVIGEEQLIAAAPCFIFFNNMEHHSIETGNTENERYLINISAKSAQTLVRNKTFLTFFASGKASHRVIGTEACAAEFESLLKIMLDFYTEKPAFYTETVSHAFNLILAMLYRLNPGVFRRAESKIHIAVQTIKDMLESDPKTGAGLKELAAKFHFSEFYLLHSFKKITGYNIKQFQMICRLALASELLIGSDKNITEICYDAGFDDVSNFTRYFKTKTGCTPSQYRKTFAEIH